MIAYRAETALANIIRPEMSRKDEARSVIRQILTSEINLKPDKGKKKLTIELHNLTNQYHDKLAQVICNHLNETSTTFPGTNMKIQYKLVSEKSRRSQEV
jgi:ribosome recycling factor